MHALGSRFGFKGQFTHSSDASLAIQSAITSVVTGSTITVSVHPAVDSFVVGNVSIGGFIRMEADAVIKPLGARVGYHDPREWTHVARQTASSTGRP